MAKIIEEENCLTVWLHACEFLKDHAGYFNLILVINDPSAFEIRWLSDYDPAKVDSFAPSTKEVINTIFPFEYLFKDKQTDFIYTAYARAHVQSKKRRFWGTYFLRMINYGENAVNQLQNIIQAIKNSKVARKGCYYIHITDSTLESNVRPLGGPCLQYLQISMPDVDTINLMAVYRNHDYFNRTFGNLLGLSFLLKFICRETEKNVGSLCCHSMHAFLGSNKSNVKKLLS
jgi:thymidylate synthase